MDRSARRRRVIPLEDTLPLLDPRRFITAPQREFLTKLQQLRHYINLWTNRGYQFTRAEKQYIHNVFNIVTNFTATSAEPDIYDIADLDANLAKWEPLHADGTVSQGEQYERRLHDATERSNALDATHVNPNTLNQSHMTDNMLRPNVNYIPAETDDNWRSPYDYTSLPDSFIGTQYQGRVSHPEPIPPDLDSLPPTGPDALTTAEIDEFSNMVANNVRTWAPHRFNRNRTGPHVDVVPNN